MLIEHAAAICVRFPVCKYTITAGNDSQYITGARLFPFQPRLAHVDLHDIVWIR